MKEFDLLKKLASGDKETVDSFLNSPELIKSTINKILILENDGKEISNRLDVEGLFNFRAGDFSSSSSSYDFFSRGLNINKEFLLMEANKLFARNNRNDLKNAVKEFEKMIFVGDLDGVSRVLKETPLVPWIMDFSLKEYENDNLIMFAAKYAPAEIDKEFCRLFKENNINLPIDKKMLKINRPMESFFLKGLNVKKSSVILDCLDFAGFKFENIDFLNLFYVATAENTVNYNDFVNVDKSDVGLLEKLNIVKYYINKGFNLNCVLTEKDRLWSSPGYLGGCLAGLNFNNNNNSVLNHLCDIFVLPVAPYRERGDLEIIFGFLASEGVDLSRLLKLAEENNKKITTNVLRPLAEKQSLENDLKSSVPLMTKDKIFKL